MQLASKSSNADSFSCQLLLKVIATNSQTFCSWIAGNVGMLFCEMQDALDPVWQLHQQKHLSLRTAAFVYALENVIKVARARGYGG